MECEIFIMKKKWSSSWKASIQPRKQRKYRKNAPLHVKRTMLHCHIAKDLRKKYGTRNRSLRTGDKVKILVGDFKGKEGKVSAINTKKLKVYIEGIEHIKKNGSKVRIPLEPSNLMITMLEKEDKRIKRIKKAVAKT